MPRFEISNFSSEQRVKIIGELYDALGEIKNREEARSVFRDLFTVSEIAMMSRRIQIAFMLMEKFKFEDICSILRASSTTVYNVSGKLKRHGEGFKIMHRNFKQIQKKRWRENKPKKRIFPLTMREIAQTAPSFTILDLMEWMKGLKRKKNGENKN